MRFYSFLLLCVLTTSILATGMSGFHAQGQKLAQDMQGNVQGAAKETSASTVPGYTTDKPSQASLGAEALGDAALEETKRSEAGKVLKEIAAKRKKFTIDPNTDPLLKNGEKVLKDPHTVLDVKVDIGAEEKGEPITQTCEEAGDRSEHACYLDLILGKKVRRERIYVKTLHEGWGHHPHNPGSIGSFSVEEHLPYLPAYTCWWEGKNLHHHSYTHIFRCQKSVIFLNEDLSEAIGSPETITEEEYHQSPQEEELSQDRYIHTCQGLEEKVDAGLCSYGEKICVEGPETRVIEGVSVTRDCWRYRQTYFCSYPSKNTCSALRAQGCVQKSSLCKERVNGTCVVWRQTYDCPSSKKSLKNIRAGPGSPFCVTGNCADSSYQANGEMLKAMAHLSVFQEMQKDSREGSFEIFKGTDKRCSRNCIDFKDCCQTMKGWGTSLHLASCSEEERLLAKLKAKNLCHQVGTYCAKKVLGVCVSKKTSYCCFGSKLLRLLQEQGRAQLGIGWGEASNPCCRGFKPAELGRIDFSQIDMSEIFEDIIASYKQPDTGSLQKRVAENLKGTLRHIQAGTKEQPLHTGEKGGL